MRDEDAVKEILTRNELIHNPLTDTSQENTRLFTLYSDFPT